MTCILKHLESLQSMIMYGPDYSSSVSNVEFCFSIQGAAVLSVLHFATADDEENGPLYLEEERILLSTDHFLEVTCLITEGFNITSIQWFNPNDTDINTLNDTRRYYDPISGQLNIDPLFLYDAGDYVCRDGSGGGGYNVTMELSVYIMPDYFFPGMVILAVNCCLCVLFFVCLIHSHIKQKKYIETLKSEQEKPVHKQLALVEKA